MDILYYMFDLDSVESTGMRTHIFEVLHNLSKMGHSIRYVNGKMYSPILVRKLVPRTKNNRQRRSLWVRIKGLMAASPLRGEALFLWSFLKELKIFFSAMVTILRHRPDIIYRRHSYFNSEYVLARLFNIPAVKELNAIGVDEFKITKRLDSITLWFYNIIERFNILRTDKIIVVTPELKEMIRSEYGVDSDSIIVIQNGANIDLFKPMDMKNTREELGLKQNGYYICFAGLLKRWQGIEYLIKSLPLILDQFPNAQLLIVGDGQIKEELITLAEQTGVSSKILFTGEVPYEEVPLYINASDVCAAPFINELNKKGGLCSLKMHEYLACGKPCVISRLNGIEIMEENHCVSLVEPENAPELATAIIRLLQDKDLRKRMGDNGRRYIVEHQSWEKVTERVAEVLDDVRYVHTRNNHKRSGFNNTAN